MIFTNSRYSTGLLQKSWLPRTSQYNLSVFRDFEVESASFFVYTFRDKDRLESLAEAFLGNANEWYVIMDYNPEISNPFAIPVGTQIRIPNR
jgi:nucleoid-associated protein YgaU